MLHLLYDSYPNAKIHAHYLMKASDTDRNTTSITRLHDISQDASAQ